MLCYLVYWVLCFCFYLHILFDSWNCLLTYLCLLAKHRQTLERLGLLLEKRNVLISLEIK